MNYEIRAVTKINLDSVREKDIIEEINSLIEHRKFGNYITNLLRFAAEHREDLEELGFNKSSRGITDTRRQMIKEHAVELNELKLKIDCIFEIALALKSAFEIGHVTALETQVDNVLAAQIVTQTQVNKLKRALGEDFEYVFKDSGEIRKDTIDKAAKEAAELALSHYGAEISQLVNSFSKLQNEMARRSLDGDFIERNLRVAAAGYDVKTDSMKNTGSTDDTDGSDSNNSSNVESENNIKAIEATEDIKFDGDSDALSSFFGI